MTRDWITASEAREMVSPGWKHNGGPTDVICHRAKAGMVSAKAALFTSSKGGEKLEERDHPIPKEFWGGASLKQSWAQGDFSTSIYSEGWEIQCEAYGVTFARTDIEAMVPNTSGPLASSRPATAENRSKGGRPAGANWEAVMVELARQLYLGDLHPERQSDIENAIAEYLSAKGFTMSESTIREHARPLWIAISREARN